MTTEKPDPRFRILDDEDDGEVGMTDEEIAAFLDKGTDPYPVPGEGRKGEGDE